MMGRGSDAEPERALECFKSVEDFLKKIEKAKKRVKDSQATATEESKGTEGKPSLNS